MFPLNKTNLGSKMSDLPSKIYNMYADLQKVVTDTNVIEGNFQDFNVPVENPNFPIGRIPRFLKGACTC